MSLAAVARREGGRDASMKDEGTMKKILFIMAAIVISASSALAQNRTELRGRVADERNALKMSDLMSPP
jgi:hypothetical protein